jgi:hypothetical protein
LLGFALSIIWFGFLQIAGAVILQCSVFLVLMLSFALTGYLTYCFFQVKVLKTAIGITGLPILDQSFYNENYILAALIASGLISSGIIAAIVYFSSKIKIAAQLIKETTKAINAIGMFAIFGIIQVFFFLIITFYYVFLLGLIISVDDTKGYIKPIMITSATFWYFWTFSNFYLFGRATVSSAIAKWYWHNDKNLHSGLFWSSYFKIILRYSGSVAFGSLVVPISFTMRMVEFALRPSFAKAQVVEEVERNHYFDYLRKWLSKVMRTVHYSVFHQLAEHGGDFCEAAQRADSTIHVTTTTSNLSVTGGVITWLGIILITSSSSFITILWLSRLISINLTTQLSTILSVAILTIIVSWAFLSNFSFAVEQIIYCHFEDLEINDGSKHRPYAMSDSLKKILIVNDEV